MNNKEQEFLSYIREPLSQKSMSVLYNANHIRYDRCMLYGDFVTSLLWLMFDTYMGDDVTNSEKQIEHFKWYWKKNIINFENENIIFDGYNNNGKKLYNYFLEFALDIFYNHPKDKEWDVATKVTTLWVNIFDYTASKSRSDVDSFIELYTLFEKSIK